MFEHVLNISVKLSSCLWENMGWLGTGSKGDLFFMIYPLYLWNFVLCVYILVEKVAKKAKKKKKSHVMCTTDPPTPSLSKSQDQGGMERQGKGED